MIRWGELKKWFQTSSSLSMVCVNASPFEGLKSTLNATGFVESVGVYGNLIKIGKKGNRKYIRERSEEKNRGKE